MPRHRQHLVSEREHGNAKNKFTVAVIEQGGLRLVGDDDTNELQGNCDPTYGSTSMETSVLISGPLSSCGIVPLSYQIH